MQTKIGRKATMAWATLLITSGFLAAGILTPDHYVTLISMIFGLYGGANVLSKGIGAVEKYFTK